MPRGKGMSRYAGLRLSLLQTPGSDMAQVLIRVKGPEDGWDEWTKLVAQEQIFVGSIGSTRSAIITARDFLDALIAEALREEWWGPE